VVKQERGTLQRKQDSNGTFRELRIGHRAVSG
jgi:hypothetical protein